MAARINNPALTPPFCALLNHVINRFDSTLQPQVASQLDLPQVDVEKQMLVEPFITGAVLPEETKAQIVGQVDNVAEFILVSHIFHRFNPATDTCLLGIANEASKKLLIKFGHPTGWVAGHIYTPMEQLFGHVFLEVYANSDDPSKAEIQRLIEPMIPVAERTFTTFQKTRYAVENLISKITGFTPFRWAAQIYLYFLAWRVYGRAKNYFMAHILPRGINKLINRAPIEVIRGISKTWDICDYLLAKQWQFELLFLGLSFIPQVRQGMIGRAVSYANRALTLPKTVVTYLGEIPSKLINQGLSLSSAAQRRISTELARNCDVGTAHLRQQEANRAYRVWMECIRQVSFAKEAAASA